MWLVALHSLSDISSEIESRRMKWMGHLTCIGQIRYIQNFSQVTWRTETNLENWHQETMKLLLYVTN
jgi:hypothetical protein